MKLMAVTDFGSPCTHELTIRINIRLLNEFVTTHASSLYIEKYFKNLGALNIINSSMTLNEHHLPPDPI